MDAMGGVYLRGRARAVATLLRRAAALRSPTTRSSIAALGLLE